MEKYDHRIYDKPKGADRRLVDIEELALHDDSNNEIPVFDLDGNRINRTEPDENIDDPCGVMMNLENIQALFSQGAPPVLYDNDGSSDDYATLHPEPTKVEVYPYPLKRATHPRRVHPWS
jgi:hypothetical protein